MKLIEIIISLLIALLSSACGVPLSSEAGTSTSDVREVSQMEITVDVNGNKLTAAFADSTAAKELAEKLKAEPITVTLNEYGGFEKVGDLPWPLTKSDEDTETEPGDIMLYQGDKMTIFYNSNSWSYTKLGHIENTTQEELKTVFGEGDVTVTLSLK
ncbi:hypothetical protein SAMN02910317_00516 [Ruminococcaceae bacterium FB2012]|nr:hypothetical protein SAMN02910317_00516 [Ruminococcaceae bacterium FB2012]